jgi:hypothetical protein
MSSERATWHTIFVVQTWTHDVPPTWRSMCIKDINGTLTNITHIYQRNRVAFNCQHEHRFAPTWVFVVEFLRKVEEREEWLSKITWGWDDKNDPVHVHCVKWKNIFFQLPYWVVCLSITNNAFASFYSSSRLSMCTWIQFSLTSPSVEVLKLLLHILLSWICCQHLMQTISLKWLILVLHGISFSRQWQIIRSLDNLGLSLGFTLF